MTGCSAVDYMELAVTALEDALPLIGPAVGIPAPLLGLVETYLSATSQALTQAATIMESSATAAEKAGEITAAFIGIVVPLVPPQYAALAAGIAKIVADVFKFLKSLGLPAPASALKGTHAAALSTKDRWRIEALAGRARVVHGKVQAMLH